MTEEEEADRICLDKIGNFENRYKTPRESWFSVPPAVLLHLRDLLEKVRARGPVGENCCPHCHHIHNDAIFNYNRRMLFLDIAKQVLRGEWRTTNGR